MTWERETETGTRKCRGVTGRERNSSERNRDHRQDEKKQTERERERVSA